MIYIHFFSSIFSNVLTFRELTFKPEDRKKVLMGIVVCLMSKYILSVWLFPEIWRAGKCEECFASPWESLASNPHTHPHSPKVICCQTRLHTQFSCKLHSCLNWNWWIMSYRYISNKRTNQDRDSWSWTLNILTKRKFSTPKNGVEGREYRFIKLFYTRDMANRIWPWC